MLVAAKALSFEGMKMLVLNESDLLGSNSFISITPPELKEENAAVEWPANSERWLSLFFEDIRPEHIPLLPIFEEQMGRRILRFDEACADKILDFLEICQERKTEETLYVNCVAGISRSGAVASFACEVFNLDRVKFHRDNPQILPNNLVLYLLRERWQLRRQSGELSLS